MPQAILRLNNHTPKFGGTPDVMDDWKIFVNSGFNFSNTTKVYAFGNYAQREVEGGFFFRSPSTSGARNGVFRTGDQRLVLKSATRTTGCPSLPLSDLNFNADDYATKNTGCNTFNEIFPGGFRPKFKGDVTDYSASVGFKGELMAKLNYDVSYSYGENRIDFSIRDSINASYGLESPTQFELGSYIQTEQIVNVDFSYPFSVPLLSSPLYTATGFEWRNEQFEVVAGEDSSWQAGPYAEQGASVGANGFQGFSDRVSGTWDRNSYAGYLDLETNVSQDLITQAMLRIEGFEDFDVNADFKLAANYQIIEPLGVRGSVGTGFRAPTVGQQNIQNTGTAFLKNQLVERGIVPTHCPEAQAQGAKDLESEQSFTVSAGLFSNVGPVSLTIDYFNIKINDRIGQSKDFTLTDAATLTNSCLQNFTVDTEYNYYGNGFNTRTQGVDIIASVDLQADIISPWFAGSQTELVFTGNWTDTKVTSYDANFLDEKRIIQLEQALPNYRFNITLNHDQDDWSGLLRLNYFGSYTELHADSLQRKINPGSEVTLDIALSYVFVEQLEFTIGSDNVLNNFPERNSYAGDTGSKYPESSPMGSASGFYYFRVSYLF